MKKKKNTIRQKLTILLLAMVLLTLFLVGSLSIYSMYSMKGSAMENSRILGMTAAEDAEAALESMAAEHLQDIAIEKAAYIEKSFVVIERCIHGITDQVEDIYENPDKYPNRTISQPKQADAELLKLGNVQDLLIQYNVHNDMISSAYVVTKSGWMIQGDYSTYNKYQDKESLLHKAAEWQGYQIASNAGPGEIVYTDVIWDEQENGECIVCASPVYYGEELVAVAGVKVYLELIKNSIERTVIGEDGYALLVNEEGKIVTVGKSTDEIAAYMNQKIDLRECGNRLLEEAAENIVVGKSGYRKIYMDGKEAYVAYTPLGRLNLSFVAVTDLDEVIAPAKESQNIILDLTEKTAAELDGRIKRTQWYFVRFLGISLVFIYMFSTVFTKILTAPIKKLTGEVAKIDGGNLDYRIRINTGDEVEELAWAFNHMTAKIQNYIKNLAVVTAEKERIRTEIEVAAKLQADMLPKVEGAYAKRKEFTLAAFMRPAKGVGGDFYDFFFLDDNHLGVVMADVSGKGVPAALFMVISRTLIRDNVLKGMPLERTAMEINESLCVNNPNGMFVTAWMGVLTISTGELSFVNAGHCRPVIRHLDGTCSYIRELGGLVLAGMEGVPYKEAKIRLQDGEALLLYTDGVTEATSTKEELYGEDRLKRICESVSDNAPQKLVETIWIDVEKFQGAAEQFDDITMLALSYHGDGFVKRSVKPVINELQKYISFADAYLKEQELSQDIIHKIQIAIDEIFSNICYYSQATECVMGIRMEENKVIFYFEDNGNPFNPLLYAEPDVEEKSENRPIGGLGIYIVKKQMDLVEYEYLQEKNRLTCYITERNE